MPETKLSPLWTKARRFLTHLDEKQARVVWVSLLLLALTGLILMLGKSEWGRAAMLSLETLMARFAGSPLGLVIVCAVFCLAALIGAPQFVLIATVVVAFGPTWGGFYAWFATCVSAAFTFYLGRLIGAERFERIGGDYLETLSQRLGKNAFVSSFVIRNIPSAPFVVVNMAFGLSRARFISFLAGCALGIIPKTALVALLGSSYEALMQGQGLVMALGLLALSALWLWLVLQIKKWFTP